MDATTKEHVLSSGKGCFIKGTLVETPEGWTPIDVLKAGDLVMSRPQSGIGEAVPKRVVNTFRAEQKEIWYLSLGKFPKRQGGGEQLAVTPDHLFCVYGVVTNLIVEDPLLGTLGKGDTDFDMASDPQAWEKWEAWTKFKNTPYEMQAYGQPMWKRADQLARGDVLLGYKDYYVVEQSRAIYAMADLKTAWVQMNGQNQDWKKLEIGHRFDFSENYSGEIIDAHIKNDEMLLSVDEHGNRHYEFYRTTVYAIEVEDYHSYGVGYQCIFVHD
ncbi:transcription-repair coupling factor (superfamily II helicase) [Neisseria sp. HSC-16F19]|nr:Hint domain-containing protein [Neisseria sp. HSC-16F19]MCP2040049.1 transcription-repair coupling factor (superfamily II helicase) [Neisseria sp. HSC-16F19]